MAKHSKGKGLRASLKIYQAAERLRVLEKKKEKDTIQKGRQRKSVKRNQESQRRKNVPFIPFSTNATLLLVGEGDFSFARSVIEQNYVLAENLIVTSYDNSIEELNGKYPNSFQENYQFLVSEGVAVFVGIDATNLIKTFKLSKKNTWNKLLGHNWSNKCLENIMFNFPHTGKGVKDQARNIKDHQTLVDGFFRSCKELFQNVNSKVISNKSYYIRSFDDESQPPVSSEGFGTILLTIFAGEPYDSWRIKTLAKENGLQLERSNRFQWENYPSYHHRRTNSEQQTTKPAKEREARIYVFKKSDIGEQKGKTSKDSDEEKL